MDLRRPFLVTLGALASVGLAACQWGRVEPPAEEVVTAAVQAQPQAAPSASAAYPEEGDCTLLHPPRPIGPPAPSPRRLRAEDRAKIDTIKIFTHGSAVIVRKREQAWILAPGGCEVPAERVKRVLDHLVTLKVSESEEPHRHDDDRQVIVTGDEEVYLHYDVEHPAGGAERARLPDGSVLSLGGLDRGLLSFQPSDWCRPR